MLGVVAGVSVGGVLCQKPLFAQAVGVKIRNMATPVNIVIIFCQNQNICQPECRKTGLFLCFLVLGFLVCSLGGKRGWLLMSYFQV